VGLLSALASDEVLIGGVLGGVGWLGGKSRSPSVVFFHGDGQVVGVVL
jgi:hypothetical protein